MDELAITVENVSKDFILPHERVNSVKGLVTSLAKGKSPWKTKEIQHALKDVSFEVKKGEFFGIVGRNGSGKSTLLKMIANIYQPIKGQIHISGKLVPFIELGVGFNPELTGRENVYLNGAMFGFSKAEVTAMYDDIVAFSELERFMDQKLKNYSSGMQVRLAFSMATRSQADILLIDEVLAVGDADFQRKCFNYFNQLKGDDTTVVFVSHDMSAVREYCDRAMLIEKSQVVEIGSTDLVSEKYTQLFMEDDTSTSASRPKSNDRWGDQAISVKDVSAKCTPEDITITVNIIANKDFERPIAGFRIRDAAGGEIIGTNTKQEKLEVPSLKKGQTKKVNWKMPNVLRDGEYAVDIALQYPDEITVADWWNSASHLNVKKNRHLPYTIDPGFVTTVE